MCQLRVLGPSHSSLQALPFLPAPIPSQICGLFFSLNMIVTYTLEKLTFPKALPLNAIP